MHQIIDQSAHYASAAGGGLPLQLLALDPVDNQSPRHARTWLRNYLTVMRVPAALVEDAVLVVSELVTNCTKHVGGRAIAEARLTAEGLEVAVRDEGQLPVIPRQPAAGDENGRGLLIVESLSARARVEYFAGGKRVSALLSHAGRAASR